MSGPQESPVGSLLRRRSTQSDSRPGRNIEPQIASGIGGTSSYFVKYLGLLLLSGLALVACVLAGSAGSTAASFACCLAVVTLYPRYWWPAAALCLTVLVPFSYVGSSGLLSVLTAGTLLMVGYVLTGSGRKATWIKTGLPLLVGLLLAYFLLQIPLGSSDNNLRKFLWACLVIFVMLTPVLVTEARQAASPVLGVLLLTGTIIASFAIIEYLTKSNPLTEFYANAPSPLIQKWGEYRVFTLLGHPLVNALFLAIAAAACLAVFLRGRHIRSLIVMAMCGVALVFTQSRAGIVALAVGVCCVLIGSLRGQIRRRSLFAFTILIVGVVVFFQVDNPLIQRNASSEGQGSSELRFAYLDVLPSLLNSASIWGTGPGLSDTALQGAGGYASSFPVESSAVQWLLSFGVVGFILYCLILTAVVVLAWRRSSTVGPSLFLTYCVAAAGFNVFEAYPALVVIPGVLLVVTISEADPHNLTKGLMSASRRGGIGGRT
jgi:hypothetical protein